MEMTGERLIPVPQAATWTALNDPEVLKDCIPGCESITRVSDNEYDVVLTAKVGPVSAQISEIFQRHADLWAADMREAASNRETCDVDATWTATMREAEAEVGRFIAGHSMRGAA